LRTRYTSSNAPAWPIDLHRLRVLDRVFQLKPSVVEQDNAIDALQRWLTVSPLNEEPHRLLMRAYLAAGDRSAALRAASIVTLPWLPGLVPGGEMQIVRTRETGEVIMLENRIELVTGASGGIGARLLREAWRNRAPLWR